MPNLLPAAVRRPSTLAASPALTAARPPSANAATSRAGAAPLVPLAVAVAAAVGRRESQDSRTVVVLIAVFVIAAVLLMSMRIIRSNEEGRAREQLGQTFVQVHARQAEFRTLFGRFASWPELHDRGARLAPRQSVRDWNASMSHWFLSLRDVDTGVICDHTGELFDESADERAPACRMMR